MRHAYLVFTVIFTAILASSTIAQQTEQRSYKSTATGRWISISATVFPNMIGGLLLASGDEDDDRGPLVAGAIVSLIGTYWGPGWGHRYAGNSGRFHAGAGTRFLITVAGIGAAYAAYDDNSSDNSASNAIIVATNVALLAHSVYDIVQVRKSVQEYNAKVNENVLSLTPTYRPSDRTVGMQLSMTF